MVDHWHDTRGLTDMDITGFGIRRNKLTVEFTSKSKKTGRTTRKTYIYTIDEENVCCRWIQASSIGQFFHRYVKRLPYAMISSRVV